MNLEDLKEKLGDETYSQLKSYVDDLIGARDTARKESIDGRKGLKERAAQLEAANQKMLEKLGLDSMDDLDNLPDAKGQAEAVKQLEVKLKRLEREAHDAAAGRDEMAAKWKDSLKSAAIAKAVSKHQFTDSDIAGMLIERGVRWEGEEILFQTDDGKLIPLEEGAAYIARAKPHLVKAAGAAGSGYRDGGQGQGNKSMTRAEFDSATPAAKMAHVKAGGQIIDA